MPTQSEAAPNNESWCGTARVPVVHVQGPNDDNLDLPARCFGSECWCSKASRPEKTPATPSEAACEKEGPKWNRDGPGESQGIIAVMGCQCDVSIPVLGRGPEQGRRDKSNAGYRHAG